jgi:uncharacterized damage-inducible protein DinB
MGYRPRMTIAELATLLAYSSDANRRVLEAAARIPEGALRRPAGTSHGSVFGTLAHIHSAEWVWRQRCQEGISPAALPGEIGFAGLPELADALSTEDRAWEAFVTASTEADAAAPVRYTTTKGNA